MQKEMSLEKLKKEVFLLEHGFYDLDIQKWIGFNNCLTKCGMYHFLYNQRPVCKPDCRMNWFRHKYPKEFKKVVK